MKNKIVLWGTNAENEKILIALELLTDSNKVMLYTFPEAIADETFVQKMMNDWRDSKEEVAFPEGYYTEERPLSVTESLLPDNIKADRTELILRAQTEWQFVVLSAKLHAAYQQELAEFKEKIESLDTYDSKMFNGLRAFWDKVQAQSRERNLFRQHADELRDGINVLFEQLKDVRKKVNSEFMEVSQGVYDKFSKSLDEIEERIAQGGAKFNSVFDELKKMQREYYNSRMSNEHRNKLWDRLDAAFKKAKERKFGPEANAGTIADRHDKRLSSLEEAIKRLEDSLRRDDEELSFQRKKVNTSEGQLEAQIRSAKIKMIEERASGKRERLAELTKAFSDVQRMASTAHEKEARQAAKEAERQLIEAKKASIKSEIEAETKAKAANAGAEKESFFETATTMLGDALMDALDTAKAVASVAAERAGEVMEEAKEKAAAVAEDVAEKAGELYAQASEKVGEKLESFKKEAEAPAAEEKTAPVEESSTADVAALESTTEEKAASDDIIIIDDVVHKEDEAKPKRGGKKSADA